ncbi:MAG: ABC transporter ATP-binding protein, partial [Panacagrimonas sp.]
MSRIPPQTLGTASQAARTQADLAGQLFRLCRPELPRILGVFILQTTQLIASVIALRYLGAGIDHLRAWMTQAPTPDTWPLGLGPDHSWPVWAVPLFAAGMMAIIASLRALLSAQATISLGILLHDRIIPRLQRRVFRKLQQLSFRFFDRQHSGAIINRVTGDVQAVRLFVENGVLETMTLGLTSLIFAVYMLTVSPALAIACMAPLPLMMWASVRFSRSVRPRYLESRERFDRMILNLSENTQGAYLVKSFALEDDSKRRFGGLNAEVQDTQRRIFRRVSFFSALLNLLNHASLAILLVFGGWMVINGQLALGTGFVVFASLLQQLSNQIGTLSQVVTSVQESLSGAERVFEILDADSDVTSPQTPLKSERLVGSLSFEQVSFGYDARRPALADLNFRVDSGQLIAVVGETGAGKSALLGLIPRHYDPDVGTVRIDGVDLRHWDLAALRRQVGMVFQE